eukprot:m.118036 g.118036  ORF g.118036 m.118036 type:complete len:369 (-) comp28627_c1_seq4:454-1560(-)
MEVYLEQANVPNAAVVALKFKEEEITISDLAALTEANLRDLGFDKIGPRMRLIKYIKDHPPSSTIIPAATKESAEKSSGPSAELLRKRGKLTSSEFMKIFNEYESDGQIPHENVDVFASELSRARSGDNHVAEKEAESIARVLRKRHSTTSGGISMSAMQSVLEVEECFLLNLKKKHSKISSANFFQIWQHYDTDLNGFIQSDELEAFLRDLMIEKKTKELNNNNTPSETTPKLEIKVNGADVKDYCKTLLDLYDSDGDGKLSIGELSSVLSVENNFLDKLKGRTELTKKQFDKVFHHYDQDASGFIVGPKLKALAWDELRSFDDVMRIDLSSVDACEAAMLAECGATKEKGMSPEQLANLLQLSHLF